MQFIYYVSKFGFSTCILHKPKGIKLTTTFAHHINISYIVWSEGHFQQFSLLWFHFNKRENLSPFTKDFRGEEQINESIDQFFTPLQKGNNSNQNQDLQPTLPINFIYF